MGASAPARSYASGLGVTHSLLFLLVRGRGKSDTFVPTTTNGSPRGPRNEQQVA
jgi:hypothetical protein